MHQAVARINLWAPKCSPGAPRQAIGFSFSPGRLAQQGYPGACFASGGLKEPWAGVGGASLRFLLLGALLHAETPPDSVTCGNRFTA